MSAYLWKLYRAALIIAHYSALTERVYELSSAASQRFRSIALLLLDVACYQLQSTPRLCLPTDHNRAFRNELSINHCSSYCLQFSRVLFLRY